MPALNSRWRLPDYPGRVYVVTKLLDRNGSQWFQVRSDESEFPVELAWFERRAIEVRI